MAKNIMMGWSLSALAMVVVLLIVSSAKHGHALECEDVAVKMLPCKPFFVNDERKPSAGCCTGIQSFKEMVTDVADLKAFCECITAPGSPIVVKPHKAKQLSPFCGVPYPFDPTVDCSKIGD